MQSKVLIIYTGGTIGMVRDAETGSLVPVDFSRIADKVPELKTLGFGVDAVSFDPPIDSSDMAPNEWMRLVTVIEENYLLYDGFVVLHGTDTMAYTASAVSFMLKNLQKPVVFTGSQLPMGMIRTDGKENFITALEIAAARQNGQALVPEVSIFFQDKLYRGNRTTKYNAENFRAFRSDNHPALAETGISIRYNYPYIRYPSSNTDVLEVYKKIDNNVALLKIFPGISAAVVEAVINIPHLKGLVLETFGSGNAPTAPWFLQLIKGALDNGIIVLNVTQCLAGSVEMSRYETGIHLSELGVISGFDMTTEAALTKLMFLLGNCATPQEISTNLNKSLRGEINL
jgi:L-asparaginase